MAITTCVSALSVRVTSWRLLIASVAMAATLSAAAVEQVDNVWALPGNWQADTGRTMALSELAGQTTIVAMFYTGCHVTCPVTVEAMQWLEQHLSDGQAKRCRFLLVTIDPGGDTPVVLRQFRSELALSPRWTLLRGGRRETRTLAESLGINFEVGAYRTSHTTQLVVVDAQGRVMSKQGDLFPELRILLAKVESIGANTECR